MKKLLTILLTFVFLWNTSMVVQAETPMLDIELTSQNAFVIDVSSGQVLLDKNADGRIYPASMTKMMTAIIAIEHLPDLNEHIMIPEEALVGLKEANASVAGFVAGDNPTVEELLYGIALPSGADCSNTIALHIAGSIEAYVELMNQKAKELGMDNTHYVNVTGLHEDEHYTTCRDLAKLMAYNKQNPTFAKIFSEETYITSPTIYNPEGLEFKSTSKAQITKEGYYLPGFIGAKTGFTNEAGHGMTSWAELNGMDLVVVNAQAMTYILDHSHIIDTMNILNALSHWKKTTILPGNTTLKEIQVKHRFETETIPIISGEEIIYDLPDDLIVETNLNLPDSIESETKEKEIQGALTIQADQYSLYEQDFTVTIPKEKSWIGRILKWFHNLFS
ncbi:MAG: D-alanyl-D-alanine carboxypeptidase [Solobacterium sp.]|nr:D-alanyl-D-alanine carboxypeptidase [Solobacterium sp.]